MPLKTHFSELPPAQTLFEAVNDAGSRQNRFKSYENKSRNNEKSDADYIAF